MLTIKDDSLRYYTISYAIFNQLSYLINSSGQMLSVCLTVGMCVYGGGAVCGCGSSLCEWRMGGAGAERRMKKLGRWMELETEKKSELCLIIIINKVTYDMCF